MSFFHFLFPRAKLGIFFLLFPTLPLCWSCNTEFKKIFNCTIVLCWFFKHYKYEYIVRLSQVHFIQKGGLSTNVWHLLRMEALRCLIYSDIFRSRSKKYWIRLIQGNIFLANKAFMDIRSRSFKLYIVARLNNSSFLVHNRSWVGIQLSAELFDGLNFVSSKRIPQQGAT